jgi:outer membrane protein assembly factor BamD
MAAAGTGTQSGRPTTYGISEFNPWPEEKNMRTAWIHRNPWLAYCVACAFVLLTVGCATTPQEITLTERQYYDEAQRAIDKERFTIAIERLQQLESRYPFGRYAEQAQLDLMYCHYKMLDFESAAATATRFTRRHPDHPQLDYALYMKGLASYGIDRGLLNRITPSDFTERDIGLARESFDDFNRLINRFPNSIYAADARQRMVYLRNLMAAHELKVADFHYRRGAYVAMAKRATWVIENFDATPAVPDALAMLAKAYLELGYPELSDQTVAVLVKNYPNHTDLRGDRLDYTPGIQESRTLLGVVTFGLIN